MTRVPPFTNRLLCDPKRIKTFSSKSDETARARRIEDAWRRAGHSNVQCKVEAVYKGGSDTAVSHCTIKSNLINGLPRR